MKQRILILIALVMGGWQLGLAQTSHSFSLEQAIDYAYQNQNQLKNAALDVEIARYKVKETLAIGLPQVKGVFDVSNNIEIPTVIIPDFSNPGQTTAAQFGTNYNMSYGLEASQLIFDGNYLLGLKASSVYNDLSKKVYERSKIETNVSVTKAYYASLVATEKLKVLEANILRLKKTMEDTKSYYESGFAEKIDYERLEVLYNNLITERENILKLTQFTNTLLKYQMGMPIQDNLTLTTTIELVQLQPVLDENKVATAEDRVEYQLLKTSMRLNELDYKRYTVNRAPTLAAYGAYKFTYFNNELGALTNDAYPVAVIGLNLSVPIIGSGQKNYQQKQAKLNLQKSRNDLKNFENVISLESQQTQIAYNNSIRSLETQAKNRELAANVLNVTKTKYDQGVGSSLEVTTAESALKEAETNYISALFDALIAKVEMDKAFGKIK
jgi:outer membrane protein TolC